MKYSNPQEAFSQLKSGTRIFIQAGVATPNFLIKQLVRAAVELDLKDLEVMHLHTHGEPLYALPEHRKRFKTLNFFVGANMRDKLDFDRVDYLPIFLSEIPSLFRKKLRKPDVALIHVCPPDRHGNVSLGTSIDVARAAIETADLVIAQVNPNMPRTFGDGIISVNDIDHLLECNDSLPEAEPRPLTQLELTIGKHVAGLIDDGATLQMGIGGIPDAVMASLTGHKNLGVHTEMWSDGALPLLKSGVINNSRKKIHPGKTVSGFVTGTKKLYDFIHDNPSVSLLDAAYVNNPRIIARNPKVMAINSAVEVDITGQVCADSIGSHIISGVGGQIDFIRGASLSEGGKPIIALPARTHKGLPRIVCTLQKGAGVVTTRAHVHYVVTEYGVADLFGKSIGERARALISIAHPEDRERLTKEFLNTFGR